MRASSAAKVPEIGAVEESGATIHGNWLQFASHLARKNLLNSTVLGLGDSEAPVSKGFRGLSRATRLSPDEFADEVASFFGLQRLSLRDLLQATPLLSSFSERFLRENAVFPCKLAGAKAETLVVGDPTNQVVLDEAQLVLGTTASIGVASFEDIATALTKHTEETVALPEQALGGRDETFDDIEGLRDLASGAPVVNAVNELFEKAVRERATDIHIEPVRNGATIRIRVDGLMRRIPVPDGIALPALLSRVKILAGLNIAERRLPQDGGSQIYIARTALDFRVATMPTKFGESAVIRLLPKDNGILSFSNLGLSSKEQSKLVNLLQLPHGMIVVTGPTGSGKTTTLATMLQTLNDETRKILTIEDPIEYEIPGVNQSQVKPEIGLTFATALRSFVRQDPDVIMVGEIRDQETARIAIHAALTGHLVLTTLHTESAAAAVPRLLDLGVEPFLLQSTLRGVIAQRLARRLCEHCKRSTVIGPRISEKDPRFEALGFRVGERIFEPSGCERCSGIGFRGRTGVFEILQIDNAIRDLISRRFDASKIAEVARAAGMTTLFEDGIAKSRTGATCVSEVLRVAMS
jgi:general secretion pathway protein E